MVAERTLPAELAHGDSTLYNPMRLRKMADTKLRSTINF